MNMYQLYRHFDKDGQLLYVGRSISALCRLLQHGRAPWIDEISFIEIDKFTSSDELARAEAIAIATENPIYNRVQPSLAPLKRKKNSAPLRPSQGISVPILNIRRRGRPRIEGLRPWDAAGISRRSWYRQRKVQCIVNGDLTA